MAHNRFTRGTWNCEVCGRLTRNAGQGTDHLCPQCEEIMGADNMVNDNDYRPGHPDFEAAKREADAALVEIAKRGGNADAVRTAAEFLYGEAFAHREARRNGNG